ncbi:hypothetical protein FACS1894170_03060 [Planctomycetales bacterium]|nr:hypothetical protein FACS1894170_03060 [Planctomycetales bacterium]
MPTSELIRLGIVYVPQKKNVFEDFTVEENLLTSAEMYSRAEAKQRLERVFSEMPLLAKFRRRTPFKMSGGERQLLAFGKMIYTEVCKIQAKRKIACIYELGASRQ